MIPLETQQKPVFHINNHLDFEHRKMGDLIHGCAETIYMVSYDSLIEHGTIGLVYRLDNKAIRSAMVNINDIEIVRNPNMPLSSLISFPGGVERHSKDYIRAPAGNALH